MTPAGYAHAAYAESLSEFGAPIALPRSGGWLLERTIPATGDRDARGPYPLFCCTSWNELDRDLEALAGRLVSVVVVADPFGAYDEHVLKSCFNQVIPFKTHFAVDLEGPNPIGTRHHRYYARRALRNVDIDVCCEPQSRLIEWMDLYSRLIERHALTGIKAFSAESFRRQFEVPGLVMLRSIANSGDCVATQLWFLGRDVAYSHLAASNSEGYRYGAAYALYDAAINYFRGRVRWLDLGGAAGSEDQSDGLSFFKHGWSNTRKTAFLCCRVLNEPRYSVLSEAAGTPDLHYFPSYRWREAA